MKINREREIEEEEAKNELERSLEIESIMFFVLFFSCSFKDLSVQF